MLKPLEQWICDECGEVIENPEDGWLEWQQEGDEKAHSFRIVHHTTASPRQRGNCYYSGTKRGGDIGLEHLVKGADPGIANLLAFLDPRLPGGDTSVHPEGRVEDVVEVMRRLYVPYYEEARLHYDEYARDGYLHEGGPVHATMPSTTRSIVETYAEE